MAHSLLRLLLILGSILLSSLTAASPIYRINERYLLVGGGGESSSSSSSLQVIDGHRGGVVQSIHISDDDDERNMGDEWNSLASCWDCSFVYATTFNRNVLVRIDLPQTWEEWVEQEQQQEPGVAVATQEHQVTTRIVPLPSYNNSTNNTAKVVLKASGNRGFVCHANGWIYRINPENPNALVEYVQLSQDQQDDLVVSCKLSDDESYLYVGNSQSMTVVNLQDHDQRYTLPVAQECGNGSDEITDYQVVRSAQGREHLYVVRRQAGQQQQQVSMDLVRLQEILQAPETGIASCTTLAGNFENSIDQEVWRDGAGSQAKFSSHWTSMTIFSQQADIVTLVGHDDSQGALRLVETVLDDDESVPPLAQVSSVFYQWGSDGSTSFSIVMASDPSHFFLPQASEEVLKSAAALEAACQDYVSGGRLCHVQELWWMLDALAESSASSSEVNIWCHSPCNDHSPDRQTLATLQETTTDERILKTQCLSTTKTTTTLATTTTPNGQQEETIVAWPICCHSHDTIPVLPTAADDLDEKVDAPYAKDIGAAAAATRTSSSGNVHKSYLLFGLMGVLLTLVAVVVAMVVRSKRSIQRARRFFHLGDSIDFIRDPLEEAYNGTVEW